MMHTVEDDGNVISFEGDGDNKQSEDHQSDYTSSVGEHECLYQIIIHLTVVEILLTKKHAKLMGALEEKSIDNQSQ